MGGLSDPSLSLWRREDAGLWMANTPSEMLYCAEKWSGLWRNPLSPHSFYLTLFQLSTSSPSLSPCLFIPLSLSFSLTQGLSILLFLTPSLCFSFVRTHHPFLSREIVLMKKEAGSKSRISTNRQFLCAACFYHLLIIMPAGACR